MFKDQGSNKLQSICDSCQLGKLSKLPFSYSDNSSSTIFNKIHCDLWGPSPVLFIGKFCYYACFVHDFSRSFLSNKNLNLLTFIQLLSNMQRGNLIRKLKFFILMVVENSLIQDLVLISKHRASFTKYLVLTFPNKQVWSSVVIE